MLSRRTFTGETQTTYHVLGTALKAVPSLAADAFGAGVRHFIHDGPVLIHQIELNPISIHTSKHRRQLARVERSLEAPPVPWGFIEEAVIMR